MGFKIKYNAPVTLTVSTICIGLFVADLLLGGLLSKVLALEPTFNLFNTPKMISYVLVHGSFDHLLGNLGLYLLIAPILEEKYGSSVYLGLTILTAIVTAVVNILLFDIYLIGLSGVVFMNIILVSFTNVKSNEIPVTFILIMLLFVGKEVYHSFSEDNISQFAHIFGGVLGSSFGFFLAKGSSGESIDPDL